MFGSEDFYQGLPGQTSNNIIHVTGLWPLGHSKRARARALVAALVVAFTASASIAVHLHALPIALPILLSEVTENG